MSIVKKRMKKLILFLFLILLATPLSFSHEGEEPKEIVEKIQISHLKLKAQFIGMLILKFGIAEKK